MDKFRSTVTCIVFGFCSLFFVEANAALVTFNNDAPIAYANPFTSADSSLVRFSEVGTGPGIQNSISVIGTHSTSNVLTSGLGPGAADEILIEFLTPVSSFSLETGHPSGDRLDAWLRVFNGATLVSDTRIALDSDTLYNQVLSYSGLATSALFAFVSPGSTDLGFAAEGFDNLSFSPVPVPAAVWLFGTALMGLLGMSRRRKTV